VDHSGNSLLTTLTLPDGHIYYQEAGSGRPIILLHAGIADGRMWDPQFKAFAGQFRAIRFDLRGYGRSLLPNGPFTWRGDLLALMDALNVSSAWLVGASFGGRVTIDFTLEHPERVRGLVLVSPVVSGYQPSGLIARFNEQEGELLAAGKLEEATELNLRMWVDGPFRDAGEVDPHIRARVGEMQLEAFRQPAPPGASYEALDPPAIDRLGEIKAPALILSGELDVPAFVHLAGTIADQIPNARSAAIPGAAHLPNLEAPERFNRLVLEFTSGE